MSEAITVLGLSGSLRRGSLNTALLHQAVELVPEGMLLRPTEYRDVPLYDADLGEVEAVERLKAQVAAVDALLICTPEYNYSVPGVLKNVLDWLSRPGYRSVLAHKPVGVMSVSPGVIGGARCQAHLRNVLGSVLAPVFPHPDVAIGMGNERIQDGRIVQEDTRALVAKYLADFAAWVRRQRVEG